MLEVRPSQGENAGSSAAVAAFREAWRRDNIGPAYSGWLHFASVTAASGFVVAFALLHVHSLGASETLVLPITFVVANFVEYRGHRGPMHHPTPGLGLLFKRHTRDHHHFFTHAAMESESSKDFKMVLFPPVMLLFFLGVIASPLALALFLLVSANVAWLYLAAATTYFLSYEWLHFAYHQSPGSRVGRLPLIARLRAHHMAHHDLALMGKYNFNINFPLCDWLFGTTYRGDRQPAVRDLPRASSAITERGLADPQRSSTRV